MIAISVLLLMAVCTAGYDNDREKKIASNLVDSIPTDSIMPDSIIKISAEELSSIANKSNLDAAAIKAVSYIESGPEHTGFICPGTPIVHLEVSMFKKMLQKGGYDVAQLSNDHPEAFGPLRKDKYGSAVLAQKAQFDSATAINDSLAKICTYWGMFQIRGSNWKQCGVPSVDAFVKEMSESETSQLELFVRFITNTGLHEYLKTRDWESFARAYNGIGYAKNHYHIRLEQAYRRFAGINQANDSVK